MLIVDVDTSLDSLHEFAASVGMKRQWYQQKATIPRYDLSTKHHCIAVNLGAIPIDGIELVGVFARWTKKRNGDMEGLEKYIDVKPRNYIDALQYATHQNQKMDNS